VTDFAVINDLAPDNFPINVLPKPLILSPDDFLLSVDAYLYLTPPSSFINFSFWKQKSQVERSKPPAWPCFIWFMVDYPRTC
jgi:hypothetical protein